MLPFALLSLLLGILAGLQRVSWDMPAANLVADHGALMTGGFIGTLICLERSITHHNRWWRLLPLVNGLSIVLFLVGQPQIAYSFLVAGSLGLTVLMLTFFKQTTTLSHALLVLGAFAWLMGNLVLLKAHSYPEAVKWWMCFLLYTIFGERLELSSMLPVTKFKKLSLYAIVFLHAAGLLLPPKFYGNEIFACSLLAIAAWLFVYDMSRRAILLPGQHRYIASWLMAGYGWLLVTAAWLLCWPHAPYAYDASLHAFFLGFVFSMIAAHVPIIFPGVFRINISLYHTALWSLLIIFQLSLLLRIVGDALLNSNLRKWGAMANGIAILLFFAANAAIIISRLNQKTTGYVSAGR